MGERERARTKRVDEWLAGGGIVLTATERAARSVAAAFHAARRAEGRAAWATPAIFAWESWVRERWLERNRDGLVLLNSLQEQALWSWVIRESRVGENLLHPGELAVAAMRAYRLLADYAPSALTATARAGWGGDAVAFSEWLTEFEARCRRNGLASASRVGLLLTERLREESELLFANPGSTRAPLLLIGFDRILKTQEAVLEAWGKWQLDQAEDALEQRTTKHFFGARDVAGELESCVAWLRRRIAANPNARLMVVTTQLQSRRGEIERALLAQPSAGEPELDFEFSLGVGLDRVGLARSALLVLRWLHEPLIEPGVDWLLTSGFCAESVDEETELATAMQRLRRRGMERPEWELTNFISSGRGDSTPHAGWEARLVRAAEMLSRAPARQSPLEWVVLATRLLEAAGWPGFRPMGSVAFQARQRWEKVLENCGSLGYDGSQMEWLEFVATVGAAVADTIFATESRDAAIQITEPLESAGQLADGVWFLGVDEENWPGRGQPHPLLPIGLQRDAGMPHSSPLADWSLAQEATVRLLGSADEVIFSYPQHSGEAEARPSRLATRHLGAATGLPVEFKSSDARGLRGPATESFEDVSRILYLHSAIGGGAATLTRQSLCPFQAFGVARLGAEDWQAAEAGLNAKQRGQLLHAVLRRVWSGLEAGGLASLEDLKGVEDLPEFVWEIVGSVMAESFDPNRSGGRRGSLSGRFLPRLLELEAERLTGLVSEWLEYERTRLPFRVAGTEVRSDVNVAGLTLTLRLDRVDTLEDGSQLVIDYKSGDVGPGAWAGDRPDDVQLPLYAAFAMANEPLEGLAFARVRPGDTKFYGRVRTPGALVHPGLDARGKNPLTDEQLEEWRRLIERLGEAFVAGEARVDPKDGFKTCEKCHLQAVCRIYENQPLDSIVAEEDATSDPNENGEGGGDA
jgi:ATP-dependent helicase/nuclease subunit B